MAFTVDLLMFSSCSWQ